jgi:hypothetical protein
MWTTTTAVYSVDNSNGLSRKRRNSNSLYYKELRMFCTLNGYYCYYYFLYI